MARDDSAGSINESRELAQLLPRGGGPRPVSRLPTGKIAELFQEVLIHDACNKRGDDQEAEHSLHRLRRLGWLRIRDAAQQLFETQDDGVALFDRIRGRLTHTPAEWTQLLNRPLSDLFLLLEAEHAERTPAEPKDVAEEPGSHHADPGERQDAVTGGTAESPIADERDNPDEAKSKANRPKNINARMLEAILFNQEALGWNSRQWAQFLKCSPSSIVATHAWKDLTVRRDRERAERSKDRRRRSKPNY